MVEIQKEKPTNKIRMIGYQNKQGFNVDHLQSMHFKVMCTF
jgi:hypothetical protein